jgi:pyridoxamine 5'-phosphate oxidase-like protein
MTDLKTIAPKFVELAHRIVWCTAASVDSRGRPFTRILHPIWQWDGTRLTGWIATSPTPLKQAHLESTPNLSLSYWDPSHDTAQVECRADWCLDDATRTAVWNRFKNGPAPVGYDPAVIPVWTSPTVDTFAALSLEPWRIRLMPGSGLLTGQGRLTWQE